MNALAFIFMTIVASSIAQGCFDRFEMCFNSLISTSSSHPTNNTLLCRDMNDFFRCYTSTCPATDFEINNIRRNLAKDGLVCDVNISKQPAVNAQSSSGAVTTSPPWSSTINFTSPCQSAVDICTKDYVGAMLNATKNQQVESVTVCSMSYDYIKCMANLCDTDDVIEKLKQGFESELRQRGVTCYLTLKDIFLNETTLLLSREILYEDGYATRKNNVKEGASGGHRAQSSTVWTLSLGICLFLVILNRFF